MTGLAAFILGGVIALGVVLAMWALRPARPDLAGVTARLDAALAPDAASVPVAFDQRLGERVVAAMTGLGRNYHRLDDDLALAGVTLAGVIGRCVVFGFVGGGLGAFFAAMLASAGVGLATPASAAIVVALAVVCSRLPVMATRQRAANRRVSFIHALGALLDFLAIQLAAGTGIKDALKESLDMGGGWAFEVMRERVTLARDSGGRDWEALEQIGVEFNITELVELGGSIALARTKGATARDTLVAKARALRQRQISAAESDARKGTERAAAPIALQRGSQTLTLDLDRRQEAHWPPPPSNTTLTLPTLAAPATGAAAAPSTTTETTTSSLPESGAAGVTAITWLSATNAVPAASSTAPVVTPTPEPVPVPTTITWSPSRNDGGYWPVFNPSATTTSPAPNPLGAPTAPTGTSDPASKVIVAARPTTDER